MCSLLAIDPGLVHLGLCVLGYDDDHPLVENSIFQESDRPPLHEGEEQAAIAAKKKSLPPLSIRCWNVFDLLRESTQAQPKPQSRAVCAVKCNASNNNKTKQQKTGQSSKKKRDKDSAQDADDDPGMEFKKVTYSHVHGLVTYFMEKVIVPLMLEHNVRHVAIERQPGGRGGGPHGKSSGSPVQLFTACLYDRLHSRHWDISNTGQDTSQHRLYTLQYVGASGKYSRVLKEIESRVEQQQSTTGPSAVFTARVNLAQTCLSSNQTYTVRKKGSLWLAGAALHPCSGMVRMEETALHGRYVDKIRYSDIDERWAMQSLTMRAPKRSRGSGPRLKGDDMCDALLVGLAAMLAWGEMAPALLQYNK